MAPIPHANDLSPDSAPPRGSVLLAGPAAGIAGGLVMAAALVISAAAAGAEPFAAIEPIGATFAGDGAFEGGALAVLLGLVLHLGVSALVGLLFAAVLPHGFQPGQAGVVSVGFAFAVMGLMTSSVVPDVNPVLKERFHDLGGSWVVAHALYGFTAGFACQWLRGRLALRTGRRVEPASA